jgi:hypothetical protein
MICQSASHYSLRRPAGICGLDQKSTAKQAPETRASFRRADGTDSVETAEPLARKAKGQRTVAGPKLCLRGPLFRSDLLRRVERAGIMDFLHLMIGEAEYLP